MKWNAVYSPDARQFLHKAEHTVSEAIVKKIEASRENPYHFFEKLAGFPYYRLRAGDYRVIADLQDGINVIAVIRIEHRKTVYKRLDLPLR